MHLFLSILTFWLTRHLGHKSDMLFVLKLLKVVKSYFKIVLKNYYKAAI